MTKLLMTNDYLGEGIDPVLNVSHPVYLMKKSTKSKGGFVRLYTEPISQHIDKILNLSVNGYRLFYIIIELLKLSKFKTDVLFITLGSIEDYYQSIGLTYKGGKTGLAKGINELIEINLIKRFPSAGRGAYQVNLNWLGFGSIEQEKF